MRDLQVHGGHGGIIGKSKAGSGAVFRAGSVVVGDAGIRVANHQRAVRSADGFFLDGDVTDNFDTGRSQHVNLLPGFEVHGGAGDDADGRIVERFSDIDGGDVRGADVQFAGDGSGIGGRNAQITETQYDAEDGDVFHWSYGVVLTLILRRDWTVVSCTKLESFAWNK